MFSGVENVLTLHLADAFIQSDLQLIRLCRKCGVKGLAQGPNSCADLIVATPGIEPPTLRVSVKYLNHYATGCPVFLNHYATGCPMLQ